MGERGLNGRPGHHTVGKAPSLGILVGCWESAYNSYYIKPFINNNSFHLWNAYHVPGIAVCFTSGYSFNSHETPPRWVLSTILSYRRYTTAQSG